MDTFAIILGGGSGNRMNAGMNKVLLTLCGRSVLLRSIDAFLNIADRLIIVYRQEDESLIRDEVTRAYPGQAFTFVCGGKTRQESVMNGLNAITDASDDALVMIHDAARCLVDRETIQAALASAEEYGSGIPALPVTDTIKKTMDGKKIVETVDRSLLVSVQTPQCFRLSLIRPAYRRVLTREIPCTDDASVMEALHMQVYLTPGNKNNIKLTTQEDLQMAESHLQSSSGLPFRIGHGYDVHRLVEDRDLILCGVKIPHHLGLLGHSDADVAIHALMDAMLGALSLGDIGHLFPDSDPQYKGISSVLLLNHVYERIKAEGYTMGNCDITIVAQKPKLAPYIDTMRAKIAETLHCDVSRVSIKATTTEKLGFEGEEAGISSTAVCLLMK